MLWERIKRALNSWRTGVGDVSLERHLRRHLSANGFGGRLARFDRARLVAIERPGWIQVFQIEVETRRRDDADRPPDPTWVRLFGVIREDEREGKPRIRFFETAEERDQLTEEWSQGLIRSPRFRRGSA